MTAETKGRIRHVALSVEDPWETAEFYKQAVGLQEVTELDGPLAILTFNRPEARNAMTWEMYDALVEHCAAIDADDAVRVAVLRGAGGRAFVSGTDIHQFAEFGHIFSLQLRCNEFTGFNLICAELE